MIDVRNHLEKKKNGGGRLCKEPKETHDITFAEEYRKF